MKSLLIASFLLVEAFASDVLPPQIIGGKEAGRGKFPWQVSLRSNVDGGHSCGGSLIEESWVITAAHCFLKPGEKTLVDKPREKYFVVFGEHYILNKIQKRHQRNVSKCFIHKNYDAYQNYNDIALLKLSEPVHTQNLKNVKTILLPEKGEVLEKGSAVHATGWGNSQFYNFLTTRNDVLQPNGCPVAITTDQLLLERTKAVPQCGIFRTYNTDTMGVMYVEFNPDALQVVKTSLWDWDSCNKALYKNANQTDPCELFLCAGEKNGGRDTCQGDSGGPLMAKQGKAWKLYGITSFGVRCAEKDSPGYYTKVSKFIDWIERTISQK